MTNVLRRSSVILLTVLILGGTIVPAAAATPIVLATEGETEIAEEAPAVEYDGPEAFFPAEEEAEDEIDYAWTYDYLIPLTMVLIALLVLALVIGYFLRVVRTRYTVVE